MTAERYDPMPRARPASLRRAGVIGMILLATLGAALALPAAARADGSCEVSNNFTLQLNAQVTSCNGGAYRLVLQGDGNLVLTPTSHYEALWWTGTANQGVTRAVMQSDGNLVVYAGDAPKWNSTTSDAHGARLAVQDDGNLVIYYGDTPAWDRHTGASVNTRPDFGNCEPAFIVENYNGENSLGAISAGHCASKDAVVYGLSADHDFEIIPLDVNRLNAPTVASGGELRSANWFRADLLDADSFLVNNRTDMVNPTEIGATNNEVCHYGGVSRRACGHIVRDDYQPSYLQNSRDFYLLDIPCVKGDSGSAVTSADGSRAVGIISGRRKSDGACIVSRLDRVFPGSLRLYHAPALDARYQLYYFADGAWYPIGQFVDRQKCLAVADAGAKKNNEFRCVAQ